MIFINEQLVFKYFIKTIKKDRKLIFAIGAFSIASFLKNRSDIREMKSKIALLEDVVLGEEKSELQKTEKYDWEE